MNMKRPKPQKTRLILFNKPFQVMSQFSEVKGKLTLADFIPVKDVYPAGRLDFDSEGLMLLTNDGQLQHQIADPKEKLAKTYWVQVEGIPTQEALEKLRNGVQLNDGMSKPAEAKLVDVSTIWERNPPIRVRKTVPDSWIELTIKEGRNRQVRRMTAAIGFPTLRLIRVQIGNWTVFDLQPGEWREVKL